MAAYHKRRRIAYAVIPLVVGASLLGGLWLHARSQLDRIPLYADDPTRADLIGRLYQRYQSVKILRGVGEGLAARSDSDLALVEAAVDWAHMHVRGQASSPPDIVLDNTLGLVVRGRAWCEGVAAVAATILWSQGLPVRLFALKNSFGSPHTALEVQVVGKWIIVDPWFGTAMLRGGKPVSADEVDQQLLDAWGITTVKPDEYHNGFAWRVFPFLDADAITQRARVWLARQTGTETMSPPPPTRALADTATSVTRAPSPPTPKHSLTTAHIRRAFVRARIRDLAGEDVRQEYMRIAQQTRDEDLAGAAEYFALLQAVERGQRPARAVVRGAWSLSGVELRARALGDTAGLDNLFNAGTVRTTLRTSRIPALSRAR